LAIRAVIFDLDGTIVDFMFWVLGTKI